MEKRILGKRGMNVTVLGYGGAEIGYRGVPEETVERLIKRRARSRSEYDKCGHDRDGDHWNPKKMAEQIDRSLKHLQTDRVDLLQLHSCTESSFGRVT